MAEESERQIKCKHKAMEKNELSQRQTRNKHANYEINRSKETLVAARKNIYSFW